MLTEPKPAPPLRPYQSEALDGLRSLFRSGKRRVMLVLPTGPLALDTPVLTANRGWQTMGALEVGDRVFTPSGADTPIVEVSPVFRERDCYEMVFDCGERIVCDAAHRWPILRMPRDGAADRMETAALFREQERRLLTVAGEHRIKAVRPVQSVPVRCITVADPSHQFLVGRALIRTCNSGKTRIAAEMIRLAVERGNRCAFVAERRVLVKQTSAVLSGYGIAHGVVMAASTRGAGEQVLVCSAQTLESRGAPDDLDLVILDEAHIQRPLEATLLEAGVRVVGLTATPFRLGRKRKQALHDFYGRDSVVSATTTDRLTEAGYLVGTRAFVPKGDNRINRANLVVASTGEYTTASMTDETIRIVDGIVDEYAEKRALARPVPRALAFVDSVDSAKALQEALCVRGYRFGVMHYRASAYANREALDGLRAGVLEGVVSVDMLTRGLDVPEANIGIFAKPYRRSFASHIQEVGRILRPAPGKGSAIVMDCAGNWRRFAPRRDRLFGQGPPAGFAPPPKQDREEEEWPTTKTCPSCGAEIPLTARECPECGHRFEGKKKREVVSGMEEWWSPAIVWAAAVSVSASLPALTEADRMEFAVSACGEMAGGRVPLRGARTLRLPALTEAHRECAEVIAVDGPGWWKARRERQRKEREALRAGGKVNVRGQWRKTRNGVWGVLAPAGLPSGTLITVETKSGVKQDVVLGAVSIPRPAGSRTKSIYHRRGHERGREGRAAPGISNSDTLAPRMAFA